ncbi:hypothetical protein FPQ18DRAFT_396486 [Pyronema domesticum]|nr:hypothetical protein FPQ18DRAFT_396486 [Pyronema domesticum]
MQFTTILILAGAIMATAIPNAAPAPDANVSLFPLPPLGVSKIATAAPEAEAVAMPAADTDFEFADVEKRQRNDCQ